MLFTHLFKLTKLQFILLSFSILSLTLSVFCYRLKYPGISYFFLYLALTFGCTLSYELLESFPPIYLFYFYHFLLFMSYHYYFTFSKRFFFRILVILKGYLTKSEYPKLFSWIIFVLLTSLLAEKPVFLLIFTQLWVASSAKGHFVLLSILSIIWIWIIVLILCNRYEMGTRLLSKVQQYYSRRACLHFIGNTIGSKIGKKLGSTVVIAPVIASIPGAAVYSLEKEQQTANYAIEQLHQYKQNFPESTPLQQYDIYKTSYNQHANSSIIGRGLKSIGVMEPAAPEAIVPDYLTTLEKRLKELNDLNDVEKS